MRKEVIYAILAGISIGLIAAFGTWRVSKLVKVTPSPVINKDIPTPENIINLTIENLNNFDVFNTNPLIKGFASPNTDIIISTFESDYYTKTNSEGVFELEIELPTGLSEVLINDKKFIVVFSTEVKNNSTSFVGTVTDISSGAIQIKSDKGGILQISVDENTTYINNLKKNVTVKQTDLAIGDYIVAIGKTNGGNKVLKTERILITSPLPENKIEVEKIEIEKLSKTKINDIVLPKKWAGPNIKELEVGQEIYVVGIRDEKSYTLRTIFKPVE